MSFNESDGLAMKKSVIGIERPGVMPASQVTPRLSVVAAGTRTVYTPSSSMKRNGFSRLSGFVSSVVYGGTGNDSSVGAPSTPAKTAFQTPLDQPPISLFRVSHCCCEPLMTNPLLESAM